MGGGTGTDYHDGYKLVIESRIKEIKQDIKGSINYLEMYLSSFVTSPVKQKIMNVKRDLTQTIEDYRRYHHKE